VELKNYLERRYRMITSQESNCAIFDLREPATNHQHNLEVTTRVPSALHLRHLLEDPPYLHRDRLGNPISWGLPNNVLQFIDRHVHANCRTLETGAGISTLLVALKGSLHTCIVPDEGVVDRIMEYCSQRGIPTNRIDFRIDRSENVLPHLKLTDLDLVLIDGLHAFPAPFIDWYYRAGAVKIGGLIVIDDTQIWTGHILKEFLRLEPEWELKQEFAKTAVFRKLKEGGHLKNWGGQPYTLQNSRLT